MAYMLDIYLITGVDIGYPYPRKNHFMYFSWIVEKVVVGCKL
jgi:hypothetical protein